MFRKPCPALVDSTSKPLPSSVTSRPKSSRVPEEVGLVGVDNWEVMSEDCRPPLTTIDLNLTDLGHIAATKLLRAIEGHPLEKGVQLLPCRLVTRRSTEMLLENTIRPRTPIV
jgi:hypothetical protein